MISKDILKKIPKVELHLHLDCSLSYAAVSEMEPSISVDTYHSDFIAPEKCRNLADFLRCTSSGLALMQTDHRLRLVVDDLFKQLQQDNVVYAEIRFAPLLHLEHGLAAEDVVEVVAATTRDNIARSGIQAGLILCTLRHFNTRQSMDTVKLVEKYLPETVVCGFDLAADEAGFPTDAHKDAFLYAYKKDIPSTAHAGEAKGAISVWDTLKHLKVQRIGHGVRSTEDPKLLEYIVKHNIHLEVCPTCNVQTDIYETFADHPVDFLFRSGFSVGINTDARALVNTTLSEEYEKLVRHFNWSLEHLRTCNTNALDHAFLEKSQREYIKDRLLSEFNRIIEHI